MAKREEPFITGHYYHIFNKLIEGKTIFKDKRYSALLLNLFCYYRSDKAKISFSKYNNYPEDIKTEIQKELNNKKYHIVEILAYCIMPSHYHLILKQKMDNG